MPLGIPPRFALLRNVGSKGGGGNPAGCPRVAGQAKGQSAQESAARVTVPLPRLLGVAELVRRVVVRHLTDVGDLLG